MLFFLVRTRFKVVFLPFLPSPAVLGVDLSLNMNIVGVEVRASIALPEVAARCPSGVVRGENPSNCSPSSSLISTNNRSTLFGLAPVDQHEHPEHGPQPGPAAGRSAAASRPGRPGQLVAHLQPADRAGVDRIVQAVRRPPNRVSDPRLVAIYRSRPGSALCWGGLVWVWNLAI